MQPRAHFSMWYVVGAFLLIVLLQMYLVSPSEEKVSYSRFKELIRQEQIKEVVIGPDLIVGIYKEQEGTPGKAKHFKAVRVEDPDLVKDLQARGVQFSGHYQSPWIKGLLGWVVPLLILFAIWRVIFKKMGPGAGVMTFGKSRAKLYAQEKLDSRFDDVAGV